MMAYSDVRTGQHTYIRAHRALANALCLNSATQKEVALVPGLSPQMAASLVRERETRGSYDSWEDVIARNNGMGKSKISALKNANFVIALKRDRHQLQPVNKPDQLCNVDDHVGVATANSQPCGLKRASTQTEMNSTQRTK